MRTIKLVLAYEGTAYYGWQIQPGLHTVQQVLEDAIAKVIGPHRTTVAGRTDTGVHALGQVVSLRTGVALPAVELHRALNGILPPDIGVLSCEVVPNEFDPQRGATGKTYRYRLHDAFIRPVLNRNFVWHVWNVDWDRVEEAARHLVGTHDFASFAHSAHGKKTTVRTIRRLEVIRRPPGADSEVWIEVDGNGFLKQMVRNVVGSLVVIGRGLHPPVWIDEVLDARDRRKAGPTAPASGLTLVRVEYPRVNA